MQCVPVSQDPTPIHPSLPPDTQMSAKATGVGPITVLGMGRPWEGLGSKITLLLEFLEDKPADDLVLFIGEPCGCGRAGVYLCSLVDSLRRVSF